MTGLKLEWKGVMLAVFLLLVIFSINPASAAGTDQVTVKKIAVDGVSVIDEITVDVNYMESNLPVQGDGVTHYYHQGPVFEAGWENVHPGEQYNMWNPREDVNSYPYKDMGAVKGTDTKDLCDLIGGASEGDEIQFVASDGFSKKAGYDDVYNPESRQGTIVLTWWMNGDYSYDSFNDGMRTVFYADTSVNEWGEHIFGNQDMNATLDEKYWHFYDGMPSSTGLCVKNVNTIKILTDEPAPTTDVIFDGTAALGEGTVSVESVQGNLYNVSELTPLGALQTVADEEGIVVNVSDKKYDSMGILLLDDIDEYLYVKGGNSWICLVNGQQLDDYGNPDTEGLNNYALSDGDDVLFLYGDNSVTEGTAVAKVAITVDTSGSDCDTIFDGTATLGEGTVSVESVQGNIYDVSELTPLGALQTVADEEGIVVNVSDKKYDSMGILLLDDIDEYLYVKGGNSWICLVNGQQLNDYGNPDTEGLNNYALSDGDAVLFLYGGDDLTEENAVAKVAIEVSSGQPSAWDIDLIGKDTLTYSKNQFEAKLASHGGIEYTDDNGVWGGLPLYVIAGIVDDDDPDTFNPALAAEGYSIKVTSEDGYSINFESADISESNGFIMANTLNASDLPQTIGEKEKPCYPLRMVGDDVGAGQLIGAVASVELVGLPEQSDGWAITVNGVISDKVSQAEFEESGCHMETYTDPDGNEWSGVPLWTIVAVSDNIESTNHWTFSDSAAANGYTVKITASDGFSREFASADIARNDNYILADKCNGVPLSKTGDKPTYPVRLVGSALWSEDKGGFSGSAIGQVTTIDLVGLIPQPPVAGSWNLICEGKIDAVITQQFFEQGLACYHESIWTDKDGNVWSGVPLYDFCGWVDDRVPHGSSGFNRGLAEIGYKVIITASDGYSKELESSLILESKDNYSMKIIVANKFNGQVLEQPPEGSWPLRVVGPGLPSGSYSIGQLAKIKLTEFAKPTEIPKLTIVKYGADRVTEVAIVSVDYTDLIGPFDVYGDGETLYKFEGLCFPPADPWDEAETYLAGFKISEPMKGTSIKDICSLAGGMNEGTEITFIAKDGWTSKLSYDVIYNDPSEVPALGTPVLSWYGYTGSGSEKAAMPGYGDGFRIFFATDDHIFGQWDMHETIPANYWHYNSGLPSCAGLSAKYVTRIEIQTVPDPTWDLKLEGAINATISKGFFEAALGCTLAQGDESHKAEFIDNSGNVWSGMPLWLLCGFVDDENSHVGHSYNDTLAAEGYDIVITNDNGESVTLDSRLTIRNSNYLIANELNNHLINLEADDWPLKLTGENITGVDSIGNITKIELVFGDEPSGNTGKINLKAGWNFISTPKPLMDGRNNASYLLNGIETGSHSVFKYDSKTKSWEALTATSILKPLEAIWVYSVTGNSILLEYSDDPVMTPPVRQLYSGWNAVGCGNDDVIQARDLLKCIENSWIYALDYDSPGQVYNRVIVNGGSGKYADTREMSPTTGFWVLVNEDCIISALTA